MLRFGNDFNFSLQCNSHIYLEAAITREQIFEDEFGLSRSRTRNGAFFGAPERSVWQQYAIGSFSTAPIKKLSFNISLGYSNNVFDFDSGAGKRFPRISPAALAGDSRRDPGAGNQFDFAANIELKPTDPFRFSFGYNKRRLVRDDTGKTAFDSDIFTVRSTYQFTRFTFIRARLDYNSLTSNVSGQLLMGWNPNPGTAFYVGYNDNFNYNGFSPFTGQSEPRFERNNRTFFIRASYLFRKSF